MVPVPVSSVLAPFAITADPKLAIEEGILLLAVDLLAVVAEEPSVVEGGAILAENNLDALLEGARDRAVGNTAQFVQGFLTDLFCDVGVERVLAEHTRLTPLV